VTVAAATASSRRVRNRSVHSYSELKGMLTGSAVAACVNAAMLILTRRAGQTLRIGEDVEVTVMAVNGAQVRIGIKAPRNVIVDREEIAERKRREKDPPPSQITR
jgi:carbon storage regulator